MAKKKKSSSMSGLMKDIDKIAYEPKKQVSYQDFQFFRELTGFGLQEEIMYTVPEGKYFILSSAVCIKWADVDAMLVILRLSDTVTLIGEYSGLSYVANYNMISKPILMLPGSQLVFKINGQNVVAYGIFYASGKEVFITDYESKWIDFVAAGI